LLEPSIHPETGIEYNKYNNYTIFEKSFYHLENNQDLYEFYLEEHWDYLNILLHFLFSLEYLLYSQTGLD